LNCLNRQLVYSVSAEVAVEEMEVAEHVTMAVSTTPRSALVRADVNLETDELLELVLPAVASTKMPPYTRMMEAGMRTSLMVVVLPV
jgi:hypothetical protein